MFFLEFRVGQWHLSLAIVFVILGFLLATAFSTQQRWGERPGPRKQSLVDFIKKQQAERDKLGNQLVTARKELDRFDRNVAGRTSELAAHSQELERLRIAAGLRSMRGAGLELVVGDAQRVPLGADPDSWLIHDYDLQIIVNALWRGGAKAIAINGERFVVNTGIRSSGSTILINSKPQGGPYKILAVGSTTRLERTLRSDSDARMLLDDYAQKYGLLVKTVRRRDIKMPPFKGSYGFESIGRKS